MLLTLEVISPNGDLLGSNRRKTVGPEGAQIGRSKESDWVINDQYISRIHARVRYVNGAFYVEGLGRNPLALNDPQHTIPNNEPQLLRSGDRFFLDEYEIRATVASGSGAARDTQPTMQPLGQSPLGQTTGQSIPDDPFAIGSTARTPTVPHEWGQAGGAQPFAQSFEGAAGLDIMDAGAGDSGGPDAGNLDPLAALGGPAPAREPPVSHVNIHQGSVLADNFSAPTPITVPSAPVTTVPRTSVSAGSMPGGQAPGNPEGRPSPSFAPGAGTPIVPSAGGGQIPDSWDRSGLTQMGLSQAPPPPPPRRPAAPAPKSAAGSDSSIPDAWDKSRLTRMDSPAARPQPTRQPPTPSVVPSPVPAPTEALQAPHASTPSHAPGHTVSHTVRRPAELPPTSSLTDLLELAPSVSQATPVDFVLPESPVSPPPASAATTASASVVAGATSATSATTGGQGSVSLEELLRAVGVPASQMSPELARELGQVLRIVVQGVMEVLQSRAEIKSQLRMSMTRMQASENNPLKFSPNVEAALHTLLVERNRGYLPTTRAFQEALTDIRNHQIAVLQGIRTAFDSMLEHFDPEKLEQELERQSKRGGGGLLNLGGKTRFRDFYIEQFENMTRDPDESFKRLFGEYFAQAYEDQMDRLKAAMHTAGGR